jgi:histidinol-phosphate aminotransferase
MGYERASIAAMHGYVPGKQPQSADAIKLNTNENPYPPCAEVMAVLSSITGDALRRYPPPSADALRAQIAAAHGLTLEHVVAVNGGDELLRLAVTTFCEAAGSGDAIGVVEPSYSLYPVLAEIHGCPIVRLDAREDWSLPEQLGPRMAAAGVKLLLVVNPHAPSGTLTSAADLGKLAASFPGVLLIDEAYVDFVDPALGHDVVSLVKQHDNVLLLRTFSKGYSLAGLRAGYGLGQPSLISPLLWKTRDSYNLDAIAQKVAEASLAHRDAAVRTWELVRAERARLATALRALSFELPDSQSNFVLARVPAGHDARALQQRLETRGILVRWFDADRLRDKLRITVGTPQQNDRLLAELGAALDRGPA